MKKIAFKTIQLFESQIWWKFRIGWRITQEYQDWNEKERQLLRFFVKNQNMKKEFEKVRVAMAISHRNNKEAFLSHYALSEVLDIDGLGLCLISIL